MTRKKILIVEDESLVAMDIQECLQTANYDVVGISSNGDEALTLVAKKRPHVVIMDIQLESTINGAETAQAIRLQFGVPVLFLTAYTDKTTLEQARLAQPYGYIIKPFRDRELLANIEMALYRHEQEMLFLKNANWMANTFSVFSDGIILIDRHKKIVFLNACATELTACPGEVIGSPLKEIFMIYENKPGSILNPVKTDVLADETISQNRTTDFKGSILLQRKNGTKIHIDGSISSITMPDGSPIGAVLVFQSIEHLARENHNALVGREVPVEKILEVTGNGTIDVFKPGAERVFGFKPTEIVGKNVETLLPKPFLSFKHKDGSIHSIRDALSKMRLMERSIFIGLLCNLNPYHFPSITQTATETVHDD